MKKGNSCLIHASQMLIFQSSLFIYMLGAVIEKYDPAGAKAGNSEFHKGISLEIDRFLQGAQNMKYGPGDAEAGNIKFIKDLINKQIGFWRNAQTRKYGPGSAKAGNVTFRTGM